MFDETNGFEYDVVTHIVTYDEREKSALQIMGEWVNSVNGIWTTVIYLSASTQHAWSASLH